MVGFFPGVVKLHGQEALSSGIFRIWSEDGIHWDELANVYHAEAEDGRVDIHPVGIYKEALMTMHYKQTDISLAFMLSQKLADEKNMMLNLSLPEGSIENIDRLQRLGQAGHKSIGPDS